MASVCRLPDLHQHHQLAPHTNATRLTRHAPPPNRQCCCSARLKRTVESDLSKLQGFAKRSTFSQQQPPRRSSSNSSSSSKGGQDAAARLVREVSSKLGDMTVGQLCRLAFILTQLPQPKAVTKPVWQSALRRILLHASTASCRQQQNPDPNPHISRPSSAALDPPDDRTAPLTLLLQSGAAPGEVLYLLRALAAWQDEVEAVCSSLPGDPAPTALATITAVAAAASSKAGNMTLQELMLAVTALAGLGFYDAHTMTAASTAFVDAIAATQDNTTTTSSSSSSTLQQQQQGEELLPHIRNHQLIVNFMWANASLGHADPLLLTATLQLLLQRGSHLLLTIGGSHLPLCMWALAASLVCVLQQQQQQQQLSEESQQLVKAVAAVYSMLACQALQLCQAAAVQQSSSSSSSSGGGSSIKRKNTARGGAGSSSSSSSSSSTQQPKPPFSIDSRRQMYQSHVWLQAAVAAAGSSSSTGQDQLLQPQPAAAASLQQLWPLQRLLQVAAEQQQQQQQQQQELSGFWQYCGAAWAVGDGPQVSGLQREVFQALQSAGLHPVLEFPAQPLQHPSSRQAAITALQLQQQQQQQQQQQTAAASGASSAAALGCVGEAMALAEGVDGRVAAGFLSVDIACLMPGHTLELVQQQGLKQALATLQQQQQRGCDGSRRQDSTAAAATCESNGGGTAGSDGDGYNVAWEGVAVAVEVDGPTHAAVNCAGHSLGATVCRDWLLRQWGWRVVVVPWWEWQGERQ